MSKKSLMALVSISALIWINGCTCNVSTPPLRLPPPLRVPVVTVADYACMDDVAAEHLQVQHDLYKQRITTLENIIKQTWANQ